MHHRCLAALFLTAASLLHAEDPSASPTPTPSPGLDWFAGMTTPTGDNSAICPLPRLEWFGRVKRNNDHAAKVAGQIQLVFDGDSITDGWQGKGHQLWQDRYAKLGAFDFGIAGDRTENLLWRLSQGQMNGIHPKLILLMIGTNNLGKNTDEQIAEGIKAIIDRYRSLCPDAVILLQGIFPRAQSPANPLRERIKEINKTISAYADGKRVVFLDFGDKFLEPDGTMSPEIMPDFLHPSAKGYQIWADAIQPVIDQYFPPAK
ncbi:MAG: GDSL-type esterase/lipase family protein [Chthoniobacterales bacterium]